MLVHCLMIRSVSLQSVGVPPCSIDSGILGQHTLVKERVRLFCNVRHAYRNSQNVVQIIYSDVSKPNSVLRGTVRHATHLMHSFMQASRMALARYSLTENLEVSRMAGPGFSSRARFCPTCMRQCVSLLRVSNRNTYRSLNCARSC